MISVRVIKDSKNTACKVRLTTLECIYPFIIHGEVLTHRALSRNAQSKRAIPLKVFIEQTRNNMYIPTQFSKNCAGMQAKENLEGPAAEKARAVWIRAGTLAIKSAEALDKCGLHKQYANRVLEPYSHMTVLISATNWANFLGLRNHPDAHPDIQELAVKIQEALSASVPTPLPPGSWHIPFEDVNIPMEERIKRSIACCARVSYLTHEGKRDVSKDLELYERLRSSRPLHASPFEHVAKAIPFPLNIGNFVGWEQYRKTLENECVKEVYA